MGEEIPKIAPSPGGNHGPHLIMVTWAHPTPQASVISIEPAVSSGLTLDYSYTLLWDGSFPTPKLPLPLGAGSPSNTWLLGPAPLHKPNGISIGPVVFAGYLSVTRQTDRPRHTSVAIGRIYDMHTMRPKKETYLIELNFIN